MSDAAGESYDPTFFATLEKVEDRHFWFRARRRVVAAALRDITHGLPPGYRVLDLGCGNGGMLRSMQEACAGGTIIGMDFYSEALRHARRRCDCPLVRGDARRPPFAEAFALVGMFDVLEHISEDVALLKGVARMLQPGGRLLITVPAHMSLWSYFDVASCHARRYSEAELSLKLSETGFEVEYLTQFMRPIYPLVWLVRRLKGLLGKSTETEMTRGELRITPGLNGLLDLALRHESRRVGQRRKIRRGTSILAVARRI